MATDNKKYDIPADSQPAMASEPAATYSSMPAQEQIVLTIPHGIEAEPLREKVNAYYNNLVQECIIKQQFDCQYHEWIMETGPLSNPYAIADNDHFRAIVNMGKSAVPFILQKMKEDQSLIYLALEQIFNERLKKPEPVSGNPHLCSWNPAENTRLWIERLS